MFQIEQIRRNLAKPKGTKGPVPASFDLASNGFLVSGYANGEHWLVSPLGRQTWGGILRGHPEKGWAISQDRRDYHGKHVYILELNAQSCREVHGLGLRYDADVVELNAETIAVICQPPGAKHGDTLRDIVLVDVATAQMTDRFRLEGLTHIFTAHTPTGLGVREGCIVMSASRIEPHGERLYIHGIARINSMKRQIDFAVFPPEGSAATVPISPSGEQVFRASNAVRRIEASVSGQQTPTSDAASHATHVRSLEMWAGNPLAYVRDLPLEWSDSEAAWKIDTGLRLYWQADEAAFWWVRQRTAICVGLDGRTSPTFRLHDHGYGGIALPARAAEFRWDKGACLEVQRVDGAPSDDLSPTEAPAYVATTFSSAEIKRQDAAQKAISALTKAKNELKFTVKKSNPEEIITTIEAITAALTRGLGWYADQEGKISLSVKVGDVSYNEPRFFALVESLGRMAAPALTQLVRQCRLDADLPSVWCGNLEHGQQAFGAAARALAGIDVSAWSELALFGQCIDGYHELYYRSKVVPHFLTSHGWCDETISMAIADIVQVRDNLGDDFMYAWRRSGLSAAAEAAYAPEAFAAFMLRIRDRILAQPTGSFAAFVARASGTASSHGWVNYDCLYDQLKNKATPWESLLFAALRQQTERG